MADPPSFPFNFSFSVQLWRFQDDDTLSEFESAAEEALAQADEETLAQAAVGARANLVFSAGNRHHNLMRR